MLDLKPLTAAGLTHAEVADIMKVSRVTVTRWMNGHHAPYAAAEDKLVKLLRMCNDAVQAGSLPLPPSVAREHRAVAIKTALMAVKHPQPTPAV